MKSRQGLCFVVIFVVMLGVAAGNAQSIPTGLDKLIEEGVKERLLANEQSAIANLKVIASAATLYQLDNNKLPQKLADLGQGKPAYIDEVLASGAKNGFKFEIIESNDACFLVVAYPDPQVPANRSGIHSFCMMKDGAVRLDKEAKRVESCESCSGLPEYKLAE